MLPTVCMNPAANGALLLGRSAFALRPRYSQSMSLSLCVIISFLTFDDVFVQ